MAAALAHHALLVAALALVGSAAWRVAGALGARGAERVVAAAPIGATAVVLEALGLGLVDLGGSAAALFAAAVATWAAAHRWVPATRSLATRLPLRRRLLLGAAAGAGLAWVAWLGRHPGIAIDPLTYHLPEALLWIQDGRPGAVRQVEYEFRVGNYPLTNEVIVAWLTALGRSFAPAMVWTPAAAALLAVAGWTGLRRLAAPGRAAVLAIAAVLLVPVAVTQHLGPHTDLPMLAWLVTAAALVAAARDRPALLAPAIVAAGLSLGTKTTGAPLLAVLLGVAVWQQRARLRHRAPSLKVDRHPAGARRLAPALAAATAAATVVGGLWYLRNLVEHGSPLWPFIATPWGDDVPPTLAAFDVSFLDRPEATLDGRTSIYADLLGGGLLLLAAGLLAWVLSRPAAAAASAAALLALVAWLNAPFTGAAPDPIFDLSLTTTRYLLPTLAAAALAVALAARARRGLAVAVLAVSVVWSLERAQALPFPGMPSLPVLLAGAVLGAAVASVWRHPRWVAAIAAVAGLTAIGDGLPERHARTARLDSNGVIGWLTAQPAFRDHDEPVAFAPVMLGVLAGESLDHDLALIPAREPCAGTRRRAGWIVIATLPFEERRTPFQARRCLASARPVYADARWRVYRGPVQTATRSSAESTSSVPSEKSAGPIAAARGSVRRRRRARVKSAS